MPPPERITDELIDEICERIRQGKRVRRNLPHWGRIHIDRPLPFLCVYRRPARRNDSGTPNMVVTQATYVIAPANKSQQADLARLVQAVVKTLAETFGGLLLLELWSMRQQSETDEDPRQPLFRLVTPKGTEIPRTVEAFENAFSRISVENHTARVMITRNSRPMPPGLAPLVDTATARSIGCHRIGIAVRPIYRESQTGSLLPVVHQTLARQVTYALQRGLFQFTRGKTQYKPTHFHMIGRRTIVASAWEIDRKLADIESLYDFLLQVTPTNTGEAYTEFKKSRYETAPAFQYRPIAFDTADLKRQLWSIQIERLEDPTLTLLFRQKRQEIDTQLTMLFDLHTPRFLYGSLQLYGAISADLLAHAQDILRRIPPRSREGQGRALNAAEFAEQATQELAFYREQHADFPATIEIRPDINGLQVSKGNLLIGSKARIPANRANALLQHEIGTHVITYHNGRAQPFHQLYTGLAGYDELQEGLAVLAEYLVGGLSRPRLRTLAARVVAAQNLLDGASFVDTFQLLNTSYGFSRYNTFVITMRVYRGGGLTKDAIYLRGLIALLDYLDGNGTLDSLYIGKIATAHIPIIQELRRRQVLNPAPFMPHYMTLPTTLTRLEQLKKRQSLLDLTKGRNV